MKVLLTIWISAVLIQEVVPGTLVRYPRQASNASSFLHTEYEAKIEQKGKHGNESFGTMSGKQAIEHDNCNDNWNAFANKCATLIKDLVASLANSVSSKPGDATNLQLHIKNTFRHLDNTHNCSCLNHSGKRLSDMDLSHIFDNLTLSTTDPAGDVEEGNSDKEDEEPSSIPGVNRYPKKLTSGTNVNPENEEDPNSTSNSRRQAKQEPYSSSTPKSNEIINPSVAQNPQGRKGVLHPFLTTPLPSSRHSYSASNASPIIPPLHYANKHSSPESSSIKKPSSPYTSDSSLDNSYQPESDPISEAPTQAEPPLITTFGKKQKPVKKTKHPAITAQTPVPKENLSSQSATSKHSITPKPEYDYDDPTLGSTEQMTNARPKHNDHSLSMTDPYSYESPDYDSSTEAPKPSVPVPVKGSKNKRPTVIPVTNTGSNFPESSKPTTSHDSLSSGMSPTPSDENSYTGDTLSHSLGTTPDSEPTTAACDETSSSTTVTASTACDETSSSTTVTASTACDETSSSTTVTVPTACDETSSSTTVTVPTACDETSSSTAVTASTACDETSSSTTVTVPTACDETSSSTTVTFPPTLPSESPSAGETEDEVLITPRPITEAQTPVAENQKLVTEKPPAESETTDSAIDNESSLTESSASILPTEEGCSTTPQSVYPTDEQSVSEAPSSSEEPLVYGTTMVTTEKDDKEIEHSTVTEVPVKSSTTNDSDPEESEQEERTGVAVSTLSPVGEGTTENREENEDHTEVSENPVLVQPTTFQTTSEDPTPSPLSTRPSSKFIPVTAASTPQDSDEGTTAENKHKKHHHHHHDNDDDDEDDCCSCESCTEEEESDAMKVKEKVCKSLEEARKELKAIFDKIKKKLRCCRKMPHTITTNTSPLPQ